MSGFLRVVPYNDHDDATLTLSAPAAAGFDVNDTQNSVRSLAWRSAGTSSVTIYGSLPSSRTVSHFSLFRHTAHGGNVRLQLYSDAAFTTQVYDSTALAATCFTCSSSYTWSTGTNDRFLSESPYWLWLTPTVCQSYAITFSGTPSAASYWQVSRVWLGRYLELARQPAFGASIGYADSTDRTRSLGGSLRTNIGGIWRVMTLDLNGLNDDERAPWTQIARQLETGRDCVLSLYPGDGTERERDHIINGKFSTIDPLIRQMTVYTKRLQLEEC